jgi:hypothetical protein
LEESSHGKGHVDGGGGGDRKDSAAAVSATTAAAAAAASTAAKRGFSTMHIRRGDFQYKQVVLKRKNYATCKAVVRELLSALL